MKTAILGLFIISVAFASYDPLSLRSLFLVSITDTDQMATATGFLVAHENTEYLITNWHVVSGYGFYENEPTFPDSSLPSSLVINYICPDLGFWEQGIEPLYDSNGNPRWLECSDYRADVVALPLTNIPEDAVLRHIDLNLADTDLLVRPSMTVSIIGFPYGQSSVGLLPIWKSGTVASELDFRLSDGSPCFLIDATTREGMSGSPVIIKRYGNYIEESTGNNVISGETTKFLGVYSAQSMESELGYVWQPQVIKDILGIE
ncbi:MAG: hypothetical protein GF388_11690 [Candidatus Aegiribacteria sp.]|nr:hypothetical protein [Candidatus Aegiribacteria sp.]